MSELQYLTGRLIASLLFTVLELWAMFFVAQWLPQWAQNAMLWQVLLTSIALLVWITRGKDEYERAKDKERQSLLDQKDKP